MSTFIQKRSDDANGRLQYKGEAEPGSLTNEAKWMIEKYSYSGISETGKTYPNGDDANIYVWDDRETYSYS